MDGVAGVQGIHDLDAMTKKRLLFTIDSLTIGGAERSLVTLLNLLDYTRYEVDLQLFAFGGALEQFLPAEVHVLPPLNWTRYLAQPLWRQLLHPRMSAARMAYSLKIRRPGLSHADKACLYWQTVGKYIHPAAKTYDVAIGYAQGVPTFYTIDKVAAQKKYVWVNVDYRISEGVRQYQRQFYQKSDAIVCVSDLVKDVFSTEVFPEFGHKMQIMWDIIDGSMITRMAALKSEKSIDRSDPVLLTVGRLCNQKGYDLAFQAAKILRDRGVRFRWYVVGRGYYQKEIEQYVAANQLQEHFILLGATSNPYAYMRQCDVYVQTSRHEGFGLTIAEARMLDRPVVCTNFEGCTMQLTDGRNGLIVPLDPAAIADAVERLLHDQQLYASIQAVQQNEKKGNTEEIKRFYQLIEQ